MQRVKDGHHDLLENKFLPVFTSVKPAKDSPSDHDVRCAQGYIYTI